MNPGTSAGAFDFVVDQVSVCSGATFFDPFFQGAVEFLCFSCAGIDAVPAKPGTWGMVKAHYR